MGIKTPDSFTKRVHDILVARIDAYVDLIDAHVNGLEDAASDNHFTTPSVPAACVIDGDDIDEQGEEIRICITDEGEVRSEGMEAPTFEAIDGSAVVPQHRDSQRAIRLGVAVYVRNDGGSQTTAGTTNRYHARRVCNRVTEAARAILNDYPALSNPAGANAVAKAALAPGGSKVIDDSRAQGYEKGSTTGYGRALILEINDFGRVA